MCQLSKERSLFMTILLGIFTTITLVGFLVAFFARPLDIRHESPPVDITDEENTDEKIAAQMGDLLVLIFGIVFGLCLAATILFACCFWSAVRLQRRIRKNPALYFRLTCQWSEPFEPCECGLALRPERRDPGSEASGEVEEIESGSISSSVYGSVTENGDPEEPESEADALIHRRVRGNEESEGVETAELESVELETEM